MGYYAAALFGGALAFVVLSCMFVGAQSDRYGEWVYHPDKGTAHCSKCGFERSLDDNFGAAMSCPNCGAIMLQKR